MIRLTELVETLVRLGRDTDEPDPGVRIMVHGAEGLRWLNVERIIVDHADDTLILLTDPSIASEPREHEHWD